MIWDAMKHTLFVVHRLNTKSALALGTEVDSETANWKSGDDDVISNISKGC